MDCLECERLRNLQAIEYRLYLEQMQIDRLEGRSKTKSAKAAERDLKEAYGKAEGNYKFHLATAHPELGVKFTRDDFNKLHGPG